MIKKSMFFFYQIKIFLLKSTSKSNSLEVPVLKFEIFLICRLFYLRELPIEGMEYRYCCDQKAISSLG